MPGCYLVTRWLQRYCVNYILQGWKIKPTEQKNCSSVIDHMRLAPTESPVNTESDVYIFTYCLPFMISWIITLRLEVLRVWPRFLRKNKILETKMVPVQSKGSCLLGAYSKIFFFSFPVVHPPGLSISLKDTLTHGLQGMDKHCAAWATSSQTWLQQHHIKDAHSGSF